MADARVNDDQFYSRLFKEYGSVFAPAALRELDHKAYNYEVDRESKIEEQRSHIKTLIGELESTKEKLKRLTESRFKSKERELAVADSTLAEKYDNLVGDIKSVVLNLTRSVDANHKDILNIMNASTQYREGLQRVLEPNIPGERFIELLQQSGSPTKLLAIVLRAIVLDILRVRLFNSNVFVCTGGDNWKQLRDVYHQLLSPGEKPQTEGTEILVEHGCDAVRKDASMWRSQTLATLERNKERLLLRGGQEKVLQGVISDIEGLLAPLAGSESSSKGTLKSDITPLVELAADLSVKLGKQRAMFELEAKRYMGNNFEPSVMEAIGPGAVESDGGEDQASSNESAEILLVVVPALFKFGNDDGEEFDHFRVVRPAQVLISPAKSLESPNTDPNTNSSGHDSKLEEPSPAADQATTASSADGNMSENKPAPPEGAQGQLQPTVTEDEVEEKSSQTVPLGDENKTDLLVKQKPGGSEPKAIKSDVSIDTKKVRHEKQTPSTRISRKSHNSHSRDSKTTGDK